MAARQVFERSDLSKIRAKVFKTAAQSIDAQRVAVTDSVADGNISGSSRATTLLTLADVVTRARQDPPSVLSAAAGARSADAQISVVHAALMPSLSMSFGLNGGVSMDPSGGAQQGSMFGGSAGLDAGISMRWTIWKC